MGMICGAAGPPSNAAGQPPAAAPVYCGTPGSGSAVLEGTASGFSTGSIDGPEGALLGAAGGAAWGLATGGVLPGVYDQPVYGGTDGNQQVGIWSTYVPPAGWSGGYTQYTSFDGYGNSTTTTWFDDGRVVTTSVHQQKTPLPAGTFDSAANGQYTESGGDNVSGISAIVGGYAQNGMQ